MAKLERVHRLPDLGSSALNSQEVNVEESDKLPVTSSDELSTSHIKLLRLIFYDVDLWQ